MKEDFIERLYRHMRSPIDAALRGRRAIATPYILGRLERIEGVAERFGVEYFELHWRADCRPAAIHIEHQGASRVLYLNGALSFESTFEDRYSWLYPLRDLPVEGSISVGGVTEHFSAPGWFMLGLVDAITLHPQYARKND